MAADDDNDCNIDWERPNQSFHAHFDCFSGAAGDMMFAACLDAAGDEKNKDRLLKYVSNCLSTGMPELAGEFEIEAKKVWRGGMGSIAGLHVNVKSRYHHAPAPVPEKSSSSNEKEGSSHSTHGHAHAHDTQQLEPHSHDSTHHHDSATKSTKEGDSHDHSHSHGHSHNHSHQNDSHAADSHDHDHGHSHKDNDTDHADHGHTHGHDTAANSHDHSHSHKNNDTNHDGSHHDHAHSHGHGHAHSHGHSHGHGDDDDDTRGPLRNLPEILKLLEQAPDKYIDPWVRTMASAAFTELAKAEAQTHGADSIDSVHFHEVGAVDSIVDTVGTLIAMHCLGVVSVSCSRLPLGEGTVWTDHGLLPVPAPATLRLLVDMPVCQGPPGVTGELVTPTGAALLKALTKASNGSTGIAGRPPNFTIRKIGIGAGTKDFEKHPNVVRLLLGDSVLPPRAKVAT